MIASLREETQTFHHTIDELKVNISAESRKYLDCKQVPSSQVIFLPEDIISDALGIEHGWISKLCLIDYCESCGWTMHLLDYCYAAGLITKEHQDGLQVLLVQEKCMRSNIERRCKHGCLPEDLGKDRKQELTIEDQHSTKLVFRH
jgi:hypothetical protein